MSIRTTVVLHAPSVHTGGGFVLLQALTAAWPSDLQLTALLDVRARGQVMLPDGAQVMWVDASVGSRLKAEVYLSSAAKADDVILCFHGLPPLLSNQAKIIVFCRTVYISHQIYHLGTG